MKLIALRWISDQAPAGAVFDVPDWDERSARTLIELGLAAHAPLDKALAPEESAAASTGAPARGRYRRRDLRSAS